ncbi:sulfotransferase [Arthrospira platensis SPKY2]
MINPFFIIGNPRSGTTLLRLMLNNHPQITVPPECGFALWLSEKYQNIKVYNDYVYSEFAKDVFNSKKFETWGVDESLILETIIDKNPKDYVALVNCIYCSYSKVLKKKSSCFGDKNNYYISYLESLTSTFPKSKILFIIRDGRDVVCSYKNLNKKNIESKYKPQLPVMIEDIAREWTINLEQVLKFINHNSLVIRYEDIVKTPSVCLSKICQFLGVKYSDAMLLFYVNNDEPEDFLQWKEKTTQKLDDCSVDRYKEELTLKEQEIFIDLAGLMLKRFGYL